MQTKQILKCAMAVAALAATSLCALAQVPAAADSYPRKPIQMIVPWAPGGLTDVYARKVAERMTQELGQPIIIENKPGANGSIGTAFVAQSAPDGHTIIVETADTHAINPSIYPPQQLKYDPIKDFKQVSILAAQPMLLGISSKVPANTLEQLVAHAKREPNGVSYATWGRGSVAHLGIVLFAKSAGIKVTHIPYKGVNPAVIDVVGGRVDMMLTGAHTSSEFFKNGTMKPLAATTARRLPMYPQVPTLQELGYKDFDIRLWYGFGVPAGTPDAVVDKLVRAVRIAVQSQEVRAFADKYGMETIGSSSQEATKHVAQERERWAAAAEAAGSDLKD